MTGRRAVWGIAMIVAAVVNCGGSPAGPAPVDVRSLRIDGPLFVAVGESLPLRAVGLTEDFVEVDLTGRATWSITGGTGASLSNGAIQGRTAGTITLTATSEGLTVATPVEITERSSVTSVDAVGQWTGESVVVSCRALFVTAPGACTLGGLRMPWRATLAASANGYSGTSTMYNTAPTGNVLGFVSTDRTVWLGGVLRSDSEPSIISVLQGKLSIEGDQLTGRLLVDRSRRNFFGLIVEREEHEVTAVRSGS